MTTVSDDRRPARRSTGQPWLDRKYSQQPADPRLTAWADAAVDQLYGARTMLSVGPYDSRPRPPARWARPRFVSGGLTARLVGSDSSAL